MRNLSGLLLLNLLSTSLLSPCFSFVSPNTFSVYSLIIGGHIVAVLFLLGKSKSKTGAFSFSEIVFLIFILWGIWGMWREDRWIPLWIYTESAYFFFYIIIRRSVVNLKILSIGITFIGLVQIILFIVQFVGFRDINITGYFDNPAGFSASIICSIPYVLFLAKCNNDKKVKALWFILAIVFGIAIVISKSRSGIVALCFICTIIPLLNKSQRKKRFKKQHIYIGLLLVVVLFLFFYVLYIWKKDSADGRLLIWICTKNMILEKPLTGYGVGGFIQSYMCFQEQFFMSNHNSVFSGFADNIKEPFNEGLKLWVEMGGVGIVLLGLVLIRMFSCIRRLNHDDFTIIYVLVLISISVAGAFSYPLSYPFVKLLFVVNVASIMKDERTYRLRLSMNALRFAKIILSVYLVGAIIASVVSAKSEQKWAELIDRRINGNDHLMAYKSLLPELRYNPYFLYNYAHELNNWGLYSQSNEMLHLCSKYFNDMDVQLLFAENYLYQERFDDAEMCLLSAHLMLPLRFYPLEKLVDFYINQKRTDEAVKFASIIVEMPEKVPSNYIYKLKQRMKIYLTQL